MRETEKRLQKLEAKAPVNELHLTVDQVRRIYGVAYRHGDITEARYNELLAKLEESDDGLS